MKTVDVSGKVYFQDDNGNTWGFNDLTEEEAIEASRGLVSCFFCLNCFNCKGCIRCDGCTECAECGGCYGCTNCKECVRCLSCRECDHCDSCHFCSKCRSCNGCSHCSDCHSCLRCEAAKASVHCSRCLSIHSVKAGNLEIFSGLRGVNDITENPYLSLQVEEAFITLSESDGVRVGLPESTEFNTRYSTLCSDVKGALFRLLPAKCVFILTAFLSTYQTSYLKEKGESWTAKT